MTPFVRWLWIPFAVIANSNLADAQSAPPIGLWEGLTSHDFLWLQPDGSCSASGTVNVSGSCTWNATATGGVLTMTYKWTIDYGHIGWSIRWLDRNLILVNNVEQFARRE